MATERKIFKFYKSYFDVLNELETDKAKIEYLNAIFNKQFYDIDPINLKGIVKFAYISQKHSIDKQVKGFKDAVKQDIRKPLNAPLVGVHGTPLTASTSTSTSTSTNISTSIKKNLNQSFINFVFWYNKEFNRKFKPLTKLESKFNSIIKEFSKDDLVMACKNAHKDKYHIDNDFKFLTIEFMLRSEKVDKFLNSSVRNPTRSKGKLAI